MTRALTGVFEKGQRAIFFSDRHIQDDELATFKVCLQPLRCDLCERWKSLNGDDSEPLLQVELGVFAFVQPNVRKLGLFQNLQTLHAPDGAINELRRLALVCLPLALAVALSTEG